MAQRQRGRERAHLRRDIHNIHDTVLRKGVISIFLIMLILDGSDCSTRYFVKMRTNASDLFKTKSEGLRVLHEPIAITASPLYDKDDKKTDDRNEDERMIRDRDRDPLKTQMDRRNSFIETSTFNPDVLNKFLEEYANKIKSTTEKDFKYRPFKVARPSVEPLVLEIDDESTLAPTTGSLVQDQEGLALGTSTENTTVEGQLSDTLNDTLKRNKYYGLNSHDDRNGWVTLDAIPWSKSKISKWQANPTTQRPWPDIKPWEKPWEKPGASKPWNSNSDYPSRPYYENNKPWYDKAKPHWQDHSNDKPLTSRPSYYPDDGPNQSQKWPPERPPSSWDKYTNRPSDIITDDRPTNFPSNWNRPQHSQQPSYPKPSYQYTDRYSEGNQADEIDDNWRDGNFPQYTNRYESNDRPRPAGSAPRPHFSTYQYVNNHPSTHPANGDGQWVLLSTNRGYSKTRQRSMKFDPATTQELMKHFKANRTNGGEREAGADPMIPVMTSKRQVRLTVLPSINGTNTTTSHGGLLEVEKTFKSVDQSRREYERDRTTTQSTTLKRRPIRNTLLRQPSSSAVLAAVGAGMLPATMAMMIPMMLGRRKRDLGRISYNIPRGFNNVVMDPYNILHRYNDRMRLHRL